MSFASTIRASEYHVSKTNTCDIGCKDCWFFDHEFDSATKEQKSLVELDAFIALERTCGVSSGGADRRRTHAVSQACGCVRRRNQKR